VGFVLYILAAFLAYLGTLPVCAYLCSGDWHGIHGSLLAI